MAITLGPNRYGKAEIRMVHVDRSTPEHVLTDLNVSVALSGDLDAAHTDSDNSNVLPTDTQKNTVYAFAAEQGVGAIEDFALRLARHFVSTPSIGRAVVTIEAYPWRRLGPHSFERDGSETRTARVTVSADGEHVISGVTDLVLMNTTDSEFVGYIKDRYTTLPEATDRILATSVTAAWRHGAADADWNASYAKARKALAEAFTGTYSRALQETLYAMGKAVLAGDPGLAEVRLSLPNRHHFLVDTAPFGLRNEGTVFHADDRPYGLIEATVHDDERPEAPHAWIS
ncbi:MAG: factor-independent urate hydroxylase [Kibdelosporangium sp.]